MKKLTTLTVTLFFAAGITFAQNNGATVNQTGNGNNATVEQTGQLHQSSITQNTWGTGHTAVVNQNSGDENFSDILQEQRGAEAYLNQIGSMNQSRLKQSGPNIANIDQEGNSNILGQYGNLSAAAYQKNGTSFADDMNYLNLLQNGNGNKAGLWQEHHAEAVIQQTGNDNESRIYQSGTAGGTLNIASSYSMGDRNKTDIYQRGEEQDAKVVIHNGSNDNTVTMEQVNGIDNRALYEVDNGLGNTVALVQDGSENRSNLIVQHGADDNSVEITQDGTNNRGLWVINGSDADENILSISSIGNNNMATGVILGGGLNQITVEQLGNDNRVGSGTSWAAKDGVVINGHSNTISVSQLSDGNMSTNVVYGNNNLINVVQN